MQTAQRPHAHSSGVTARTRGVLLFEVGTRRNPASSWATACAPAVDGNLATLSTASFLWAGQRPYGATEGDCVARGRLPVTLLLPVVTGWQHRAGSTAPTRDIARSWVPDDWPPFERW